MMSLAMLFAVAVAQSVNEIEPSSGEVSVEMGVADMMVHSNSHSKMMRRQSGTIGQAINLADIQEHSWLSERRESIEKPSNASQGQAKTDTEHRYLKAIRLSKPEVYCTFDAWIPFVRGNRKKETSETPPKKISCNGQACGGDTRFGDNCKVNGVISGNVEYLSGLVPSYSTPVAGGTGRKEKSAMYFTEQNKGSVQFPDNPALVSSPEGYPNRTITLWVDIPNRTGHPTDPKVIYSEGDAGLGGVSIYWQETFVDKNTNETGLYLSMFAWNHKNNDVEYGTKEKSPEPIRCPKLFEEGGTYFVAFIFQQHHQRSLVWYNGRIWKQPWRTMQKCGSGDFDNVTLPTEAKIPKTGHDEGRITFGSITNSTRVNGYEEGILNATNGHYSCDCSIDTAAIYNRPLTDDELYKTPKALLCEADEGYNIWCKGQAEANAKREAAADVLKGNGGGGGGWHTQYK